MGQDPVRTEVAPDGSVKIYVPGKNHPLVDQTAMGHFDAKYIVQYGDVTPAMRQPQQVMSLTSPSQQINMKVQQELLKTNPEAAKLLSSNLARQLTGLNTRVDLAQDADSSGVDMSENMGVPDVTMVDKTSVESMIKGQGVQVNTALRNAGSPSTQNRFSPQGSFIVNSETGQKTRLGGTASVAFDQTTGTYRYRQQASAPQYPPAPQNLRTYRFSPYTAPINNRANVDHGSQI